MAIKVAVLGPEDIVNKTIEEGAKFEGINLINYGYKSDTETLKLVHKCKDDVDMILFTGPVPYYMAKKYGHVSIPMRYISYSGSAFYKTLFDYLESVKWNNNMIIKFSIDTIKQDSVNEMLEELGINDYQTYVKEYEDYISAEELVKFHEELYRSGKVNFTVTCLTSAYERLEALDIPVFRIVPTLISIRQTLQLVSLEAKNLLSKKSQICAGIVRVLNWEEMNNYSPSEYEQQRMKLTMTELFINFCETMRAAMKFVNEDEYVFYTTRGAIESITENYKYMPLIQEVNNRFSFKVCIGLGYGSSANEAERNSVEALKYAINYNKNSCYIVMEDGKIKGPLEPGKGIEFYARSEESEILELAEKTQVSVMTLNRISGIINTLGKNTITANEIADVLNITLRSARRILNSLEEAGIASVVGEEQPAGRGRPRQIFKINI